MYCAKSRQRLSELSQGKFLNATTSSCLRLFSLAFHKFRKALEKSILLLGFFELFLIKQRIYRGKRNFAVLQTNF